MITALAPSPSIDVTYLVDRLTPGHIHRPAGVHRVAGGKGLNLARAAGALGADVLAVGPVGGGFGDWLARAAAAEGIAFQPVQTSAATRMCVSVADRATGTLTEFYEHAAVLEPAEWEALEEAAAAAVAIRPGWLTVSGSLPPGAPGDGVARLVRMARAAGVRVAVDTHGPALVAALAAGPDLVKVNTAEAAEALGPPFGAPADVERLAAALAARCGPDTTAVVTAAAAGAVARFPGERLVRSSLDVRGDYPVGSGDAFLAGLVAALDLDAAAAPARVLALAAAAAAANALQPAPGRLDPAVAAALAARVAIT